MEVDASYHFNPLESRKAFDISALVAAYRFSYNPTHTPYWEKYNFSQIFLVMEGDGIYTTENGTYPIASGMMIYRPAYHSSMYEWTSHSVRFALISFVCASPAMEAFGEAPMALYEEESATLLDVIATGARVCEPIKETEPLRGMRVKESTPNVVIGFIASSLERFLSMVYCRLRHIDLLLDESQKVSALIDELKLTDRVKQYLAEHIGEQLSVAAICAQFGMSQTGLMRKFRRETGCGIIEYFTTLKIDMAKQMIRKSAQSFTQISEALGFSSVNYFSKVFKAHVGMTPTDYSRHVSKRLASV